MREVKFRAWDGYKMWYPETKTADDCFTHLTFFNREYVVGGTIVWGLYADGLENRVSTGEYHQLMQYTGLKDKNGKEIYEGDIVRCGKAKDAPLALIEFRQQAFVLCYLPKEKKSEENVYDYMGGYVNFKVLGNIYENPELLLSKAQKVEECDARNSDSSNSDG